MIQESFAQIGALEFRRQFDDADSKAPEHGRIEWKAQSGIGQFRDEDFMAASQALFGGTDAGTALLAECLEQSEKELHLANLELKDARPLIVQQDDIRKLQETNTILNEQLSQARSATASLPVAGTIGDGGQLGPTADQVAQALARVANASDEGIEGKNAAS